MKGLKKTILISIIALLLGVLVACSGITTPTNHTVTFATNGGSAVATIIESVVEEAPVSERSGYSLEGWYLDEEMTIRVNFPYSVARETVMYANWEKTYNIRYIIGGENYAVYSLKEGASVPTLSQPTRKGYVFGGWLDEIPTHMPAEDIIIRGNFSPNTYKIAFGIDKDATIRGTTGTILDADKGELPTIDVTYGMSFQQAFNSVVATRPGYDFDCWTYYDPTDRDRKDYVPSGTWDLTSNLLLRPKWQVEGSVGLVYTLNDEGDAYIVSDYERDNEEVIIPEKHEGKNITSIGESAFMGSKNLKSVSLPSTIVTIGDSAFRNCPNLTDINIPISVTDMGKSVFESCTSLKTITLPSNIKAIDNSAFAGATSLESVHLAEGALTKIGEYAFSGAISLKYIYLSGVTHIKSITIPKSVEILGAFAFENCTSIEAVTFEAGSKVSRIGTGTFLGCELLIEITLPRVTSIGIQAFKNCTSLFSIGIPDSVKDIGGEAFMGCASLGRFTIPASVTKVQAIAFYGCENLAGISISTQAVPSGFEIDWNLKEHIFEQGNDKKYYHTIN